MFKVKLEGNKLNYNMKNTPDGHRLINATEMGCDGEIKLPAKLSPSTAKSFVPKLEKTFNALAKQKSGTFIKDINSRVNAIGKILENSDPKKAAAARSSKFLNAEEKEIRILWDRWSNKLAPRIFDEAVQTLVKSANEKDLQGLSKQRLKVIGRVTIVPTLTIASAAVSAATGNAAGVASALLKGTNATLKAVEELSGSLNDLRTDQKAIEQDFQTLSKSLQTVAARINSLDKHRKSTERKIIAIASASKVLRNGLGNLEKTDPDAAKMVAKKLNQNSSAIQALADGLTDTAPLKQSWKAIAVEHKKMLDAIKATSSDAPKSLRDTRDLIDANKEILAVLSKIT
ncbi:MAG: hypothetical protein AB3N12_11845 [Ruegeria sp.]